MAKALVGYLGGTDPRVAARLASENRRLKERVADLETALLRARAENDALAGLAEQLRSPQMQPA